MPETGVEPATPRLGTLCSIQAELLGRSGQEHEFCLNNFGIQQCLIIAQNSELNAIYTEVYFRL